MAQIWSYTATAIRRHSRYLLFHLHIFQLFIIWWELSDLVDDQCFRNTRSRFIKPKEHLESVPCPDPETRRTEEPIQSALSVHVCPAVSTLEEISLWYSEPSE